MNNKFKRFIRYIAYIPAILFFCMSLTQTAKAANDTDSYDLTKQCGISVSEGDGSLVTDEKINTYWQLASEGCLTIRLPDSAADGYLQVDLLREPKSYTVTFKDALGKTISTYELDETFIKLKDVFSISENAASVEIKTGSAISAIHVFSKEIPDDKLIMWKRPVKKAALMLISAHQDDEFIYMGGILPLYAVERNMPTVVVYMANCGRTRREEAQHGLWRIGIKNYPVFLNFADKRTETMEECGELWGEDTATEKLVRVIRQYKPEVIVTHDLNGEYGHNAHKYTAYAVQRAVGLAADPKAYPESAAEYGSWQVKKLYLHLYPENQIKLDYSEKLSKYGGKTALEIAVEGFSEHQSQQKYYQVESGGKYDNALFGLAFTTAGNDVAKNDLFENIADSVQPLTEQDPEAIKEPQPSAKQTPQGTQSVPQDTDAANTKNDKYIKTLLELAAVVITIYAIFLVVSKDEPSE